MSVLETRGGIPKIVTQTVDNSAGLYWDFKGTLKHLQIQTGATGVRVYFTEDDFTADTNYFVVNDWEGPVEIRGIWLRGDGGNSDVTMIPIYRRG